MHITDIEGGTWAASVLTRTSCPVTLFQLFIFLHQCFPSGVPPNFQSWKFISWTICTRLFEGGCFYFSSHVSVSSFEVAREKKTDLQNVRRPQKVCEPLLVCSVFLCEGKSNISVFSNAVLVRIRLLGISLVATHRSVLPLANHFPDLIPFRFATADCGFSAPQSATKRRFVH